MQKTVYYCDSCRQIIGDKKHVSIRFGQNSGISLPPEANINNKNFWRVNPDLQGKFVHFCKIRCLNDFFQGLLSSKKK